VTAVEASPGEGTARFDRDAPQIELASDTFKGGLKVIGGADGDAAGCDNKIAETGSLSEAFHGGFELVGNMCRPGDGGSGGLGEGGEEVTVAVGDFSGEEGGTGIDEFVA